MKRLEIVVGFFALLLVSTIGIAISQSPQATPSLTIHLKNTKFVPDSASVPAGSTIVFVNDDPVAHTVTAKDQSFDSKDIGPGKSWQTTFSKAGTYAYMCIYHPGMAGQLTVTSSDK